MMDARCQECVNGYFVGWEFLLPAQLYPDPHCPAATPWCPLYEAILKRVGQSIPSVASLLAGVRAKMKAELERGEVRAQPKPAWRPNDEEPLTCPICYGPLVDGQCWKQCTRPTERIAP
jgi:hypothetical protein